MIGLSMLNHLGELPQQAALKFSDKRLWFW